MPSVANAILSADARRARMLDMLETHGEQSVEQLAEVFGVTGMTIRRDLQELATQGKVIRTHGGATPTARISFEFRFLERATQQAAQKQAIAESAASLVEPGQSVLLDSGTTTLAVARKLRELSRVTVITTSLPIASELFGLEHVDLILVGGVLRKDAPDLTGALAEHSLDMLRADVAFIGADGVGLDGSLYTATADLARTLCRMAEIAGASYAVADSSKIGRQELMRFGRLHDWCGLITDADMSAKDRKSLEKAGATVHQPGGMANSEKGRS